MSSPTGGDQSCTDAVQVPDLITDSSQGASSAADAPQETDCSGAQMAHGSAEGASNGPSHTGDPVESVSAGATCKSVQDGPSSDTKAGPSVDSENSASLETEKCSKSATESDLLSGTNPGPSGDPDASATAETGDPTPALDAGSAPAPAADTPFVVECGAVSAQDPECVSVPVLVVEPSLDLAGTPDADGPAGPVAEVSAAPEVVVEEEATLAAQLARGFLSCARCGAALVADDTSPGLLSACLHSLCQPCVRDAAQADHANSIGENSESLADVVTEHGLLRRPKSGEVRCAVCESVSSAVEPHPLLEDVLRLSQRTGPTTRCGQCAERNAEEVAVANCVDCSTALCRECVNAHKITRATWGHDLKMLPQGEWCAVHNKVYDYFCDTCDQLCCGECILSNHRTCHTVALDVKTAAVNAEITAQLASLTTTKEKVQEVLETIRHQLTEAYQARDESVAHINAEYEKYQQASVLFFRRQYETARHRYDQHLGQIRQRLTAVQLVQQRAQNMEAIVTQLLASTNPSTSLHYARPVSELARRLQRVELAQADQRPPPELSLRRVLGVDRVYDSLALLLYDSGVCMQQSEKTRICVQFLEACAELLQRLLHGRQDTAVSMATTLLADVESLPRMSPELMSMVSHFSTLVGKKWNPRRTQALGAAASQAAEVVRQAAAQSLSVPAAAVDPQSAGPAVPDLAAVPGAASTPLLAAALGIFPQPVASALSEVHGHGLEFTRLQPQGQPSAAPETDAQQLSAEVGPRPTEARVQTPPTAAQGEQAQPDARGRGSAAERQRLGAGQAQPSADRSSSQSAQSGLQAQARQIREFDLIYERIRSRDEEAQEEQRQREEKRKQDQERKQEYRKQKEEREKEERRQRELRRKQMEEKEKEERRQRALRRNQKEGREKERGERELKRKEEHERMRNQEDEINQEWRKRKTDLNEKLQLTKKRAEEQMVRYQLLLAQKNSRQAHQEKLARADKNEQRRQLDDQLERQTRQQREGQDGERSRQSQGQEIGAEWQAVGQSNRQEGLGATLGETSTETAQAQPSLQWRDGQARPQPEPAALTEQTRKRPTLSQGLHGEHSTVSEIAEEIIRRALGLGQKAGEGPERGEAAPADRHQPTATNESEAAALEERDRSRREWQQQQQQQLQQPQRLAAQEPPVSAQISQPQPVYLQTQPSVTVLGQQPYQYVVAQVVDQAQVLVAEQGLPTTPQRLVVSEPVTLLASPQQLLMSSPVADPAARLPTLAPRPQAAAPRPAPAPAPAPQNTSSPARKAGGAGRGKLPVQVTTRPARADRSSVVVHMPMVLEMSSLRQREEPDVLEVPVLSPEVPVLDPTEPDAGFEDDPPPVEDDPLFVDTKSLFVDTKMEVVENEMSESEARPSPQLKPAAVPSSQLKPAAVSSPQIRPAAVPSPQVRPAAVSSPQVRPASDGSALPSMPAMEDDGQVRNGAGWRQDRDVETPRAQKRPFSVMRPRQSSGRAVSAAAEKAGPTTQQLVGPPASAGLPSDQRARRPAQASEPSLVKPDQKKPTQAVLPTPRPELSAPTVQNRPPPPASRGTRPTAAADARPKVLAASHLNILKSFRKLKRQQSLVGDQAGPTRKRPRVGGSSGVGGRGGSAMTGPRPPRDTDCERPPANSESARPQPAAAARGSGRGRGRGRGRGGLARQRSLLVDDAGRKVSRAGVSVDTPLTDLLDSMLLTPQGSGGAARPAVPQATDKFILENCAPRGGHAQPRRRRSSADSVLMTVEEPAETLTAAELAAVLSRPSSAASRPAGPASRPDSPAGDGPPSAVSSAAGDGPASTVSSLCGSRPGSAEPADHPRGNEPAGVKTGAGKRAETAAASDGRVGADAVKVKQHPSSEAGERQERTHQAATPGIPKSAAAASVDVASSSCQNVLNDRSEGKKHKASGEKLRGTSSSEKSKSKNSNDTLKVKSSSVKSKDKSCRKKSRDTSLGVKSKSKRSSENGKSVPCSDHKLQQTASSKVGPSPKSVTKSHPTKPGETGSGPSTSKKSGSATSGKKPGPVLSAEKMTATKKSKSEHSKSRSSAMEQKPGHKNRSSASSRPSMAASAGGRSVGSSATKATTANKVDHKRVEPGRADARPDDCTEFVPPPEPDDLVNDPSVLLSDLAMSESSSSAASPAPSSSRSSRSRCNSSSSDSPAPVARASSSSSDGSPGPRLRGPPSPPSPHVSRPAARRLSSLSSDSSVPAGRASSSPSAASRSPSPAAQRQRPPSPQLSPSKGWSLTATASRPLHLVIPPEPEQEALLATWNRRHDPLGIGFSQRVLWQPPPRGPASPNISYCVLCWDGGDLLLCDYCDKAFHEDCYIGPMQDDERGQWRCAFCTPVPQLLEPDVWRKGGGRMNSADRKVARRLLMELYAAYYPCLYFRKRANLEKLPEFSKMESPVCLDEIRDRLLAGGFRSLTQLLQELKRLMSVLHVLKKGTAPYKYLRELYELFDTFVRDNMPRFWEQLDDS